MRQANQREGKGQPTLAPLFGDATEGVLFLLVVAAVALVALFFQSTVSRVFDVPKALALKTLAGGTFLVWLGVALIGPGIRWRSASVFAAPVAALTGAFALSTVFSIDVQTSWYGVYERQFGLQGFLACVGIFFVAATCLASKRGAVLGLVVIALLGGMVGAYAVLQANGHDPWPFFREPHNKVYSTLGNATFAGNSLALIFPVMVLTSLVGTVHTVKEGSHVLAWGLGILLTLFLMVGLGYLAAHGLSATEMGASALRAQSALRFGFFLSALTVVVALGFGSQGPVWLRLESEGARRFADALAAGAMVACAILVALGLLYTRTRGAWVGTFVATGCGLVLAPRLVAHRPRLQTRVTIGGGVALLAGAVFVAFFAATSDNYLAKTIRSIPKDLNPMEQDCGKGQCTRPYLWYESFRVFTEHDDTLRRIYEDEDDRAAVVQGSDLEKLPYLPAEARTDGQRSFDTAWRTISVWFFGIGIETYRYAFMSHKSKRLEELDPMTNHDNPHNNYLYVLASLGPVGLLAYLWLLWSLLRQSFLRFWRTEYAPWERGVALGVVLSFLSYAVYSLAGFDSVACSVFFYLLLGVAAVLFEPSYGQKRAPLSEWVIPSSRAGLRPVFAGGLALILGVPLVSTVFSGYTIHSAEKSFAKDIARGKQPGLEQRLSNIKEAIEMSPWESHYKQVLGSSYSQAAQRWLQGSRKMLQVARQSQSTDPQKAQKALSKAQQLQRSADLYARYGEISLMAALEHAWAPENIFISLFQLKYALGDDRGAERALERALRHSPHLGAVRANLAALKASRKAWDEAIVDCEWVMEVDQRSHLAFRTCGQAYLEKGELDRAFELLNQARRLVPRDPLTRRALEDLKKARRSRGDFGPPPSAAPPRAPANTHANVSTTAPATAGATSTIVNE